MAAVVSKTGRISSATGAARTNVAGALREVSMASGSHDQSDQQTSGIPQEDGCGGPVRAQESQQGSGQGNSHHGRRPLASEEGHPGQGQAGDEADAAQQAIHAVEQIERVDRPQEKEQSEGPGQGAKVETDPKTWIWCTVSMRGDDDNGRQNLSQEFVANLEETQVIQEARDPDDPYGQQQAPQVPADRLSSFPCEEPGQESHEDRQDHRGKEDQAADDRSGTTVPLSLPVRPIDQPQAPGRQTYQRSQGQAESPAHRQDEEQHYHHSGSSGDHLALARGWR